MQFLSLALAKSEDVLDRALDKITTYRLVLYSLIIYVLAAVVPAIVHKLPFSAGQLLLSAAWLVVVCGTANWILAKLLKVPANQESYLITALILSLIMTPASSVHGLGILAVAGLAAILSKFVIVWHGRHIFNPAALGAFIVGASLHTYASWWIGTKPMIPFVLIGGFLIVKKIKRIQMVAVLGAIYMSYALAYAPAEHAASTLVNAILISPVIFFATIMFTEPLTSPTTLNQQLIYALVVGGAFSITNLHLSPEEALLIGGGLTFLMSPNRSTAMKLLRSQKEARGIYSYVFQAKNQLAFAPGQYMEWTLPGVRLDSRGNRRYFTLASSPTEQSVAFSIRMPKEDPSGFKSSLAALKPGGKILASHLAGDFVLPTDPKEKIALLAGGIGVTPFRSMVKYQLDKDQWRNITLVYSANEPNEFAFTELFKKARDIGLSSTFVLSRQSPGWRGPVGRIDEVMISKLIPDYMQRRFYISGPQGYVANTRKALLALGVPYGRIVMDYFPGYS